MVRAAKIRERVTKGAKSAGTAYPLVSSGSLVGRLAEDIGRGIVSRAGEVGASLPTEPEIQKSYGVSRTVVREATRLLAAKGLISVRPKTGVRIRPVGDWNMFDPDVMRWHVDGAPDLGFILSLYEVREIFEPQAAKLAAERIQPAEREQLARAMEGIATHPRGSHALVDSDLEFHRVILAAAGNPVLRSFGALIEQTMAISFALTWRKTPLKESVEQHRIVCDAIMVGDSADATYAMRNLVRSARGDILAAMSDIPGVARRQANGAKKAKGS
jgi:DNA-binding FadR family transcriptional regulator